MALEITDANFQEVVLDSDKPVLVDFWAVWCGPCRTISPIVDELHNELEGKAVIGKVNVDENSDTPVKFGVRNIPTLLVFKNGEVVDKIVGAVPKSQIQEKIEAESMVILFPISQLGWLSACFFVTFCKNSEPFPLKGPPDAVKKIFSIGLCISPARH